jgi:flagellar biosynthesis/type III secretory pathway M-ring protein FliF/YscJ
LLGMRRRKSTAVQATTNATLSEGGEAGSSFEGQLASRAASQERLDAEALHALKLPAAGTKKSEVLTKHLKKAVKDDPAASAQLLRTWIHENET